MQPSVSQPGWNEDRAALWRRIKAHPFEDPTAALDFSARLAEEQRWSRGTALAAIEEYRRFCFLACISPAQVTPSEEVDEVWHLHLIHTRDYWDVWCADVLRRALHHGPTRGGQDEAMRYRDQYAAGLALYEQYFGPPPETYWPSVTCRFAPRSRFRRVDLRRAIVLPRPRLSATIWRAAAMAAAGVLLAGPAVALSPDVMTWPSDAFIPLYVALVASAGVLALWRYQRLRRAPLRQRADDGLNTIDIAYLAGGAERAFDVVTARHLTSGSLDYDGRRDRLFVRANPADLPHADSRVLAAIAGSPRRADQVAAAAPVFAATEMFLRERGLVTLPPRDIWQRTLPAWPLLPIAGLGIARLAHGMGVGRPVEHLVALLFATAGLAAYVVWRWPHRTTGGDEALERFRAVHARLMRAPQIEELTLAVALVGVGALAHTPWAAYAKAATAAGASSCSGGGDGGDGGDGGGCGGCGGGCGS